VRGAARGLIPAVVALAWTVLAVPRSIDAAPFVPAFQQAVRGLDGGQFLEDEPIWVCDPGQPAAGNPAGGSIVHGFRIVGRDDQGRAVPGEVQPAVAGSASREGVDFARAGEFVQSLGRPRRDEVYPLGGPTPGGLRAGLYEIRPATGDTARVLARFRVLRPRGSELAVRGALARAARLAAMTDPARRAEAARLYEAVLARYPRTSYRTAIYAGLWRVRAHSSFAGREARWLEQIFAHFHGTCFGTWALDVYMREVPPDEARTLLRRLVGLYPDTSLSRAAARYL
jgi:hypothetical protein